MSPVPAATPAGTDAALPTPPAGDSTPSNGGDAPIGLILVVVAGLAFAALGVFQSRRGS
jgi:hypothetical protein